MSDHTSSRATAESPGRQTLSVVLTLGVILLLGASLRLVGLDWDEGHHLHPDERFLSMVVSSMNPPSSLREYFDTLNSPLNPNNVGFGFFVYGDFPITLTFYVGRALGMTTYYDNYLVGRALSATADLLVIALLFFIGKRLFDARAGLLGSALYAAAAFPIQTSHFFTVDSLTNLFVVVAFLFTANVLKRHRWENYVLFGVALGLAMASKVSVFPLAVILVIAVALREAGKPPSERRLTLAILGLALAGVMTALIFRVAQPYAFLPPGSGELMPEDAGAVTRAVHQVADWMGIRPNPLWLNQMEDVRRQVSGQADMPPNHQWGFRPILIYPWLNMVRVGLGWPLGVFAWLAWLWAIWEVVRKHPGWQALVLPIAWVGLFFTWQGIGWVKTMRYFLPVYPFLLLLAGWALVTAWDRVQGLIQEHKASPWHRSAKVIAGLTGIVVASSYLWGIAVSQIYTRPVTRVAASAWIYENIPSDITFFFQTENGPRQYQLGLPNTWLPPDQVTDDSTHPGARYTLLSPGVEEHYNFRLPFDGILVGIRLNHVVDPEGRSSEKALRVTLMGLPEEATDLAEAVLAEATITDDFLPGEDPRGETYNVPFETLTLGTGRAYTLVLEADESGPLQLASASIAPEGAWDDSVPLPMPGYNPWGAQFQAYDLEIIWEDLENKRDRLQYILDHTDYILISSNRFYDSLRRNPARWPMTLAYYEALFSGELGFELVRDFTSRPNLGPIEFVDDSAEEAWTVYDHPRVLIFQKTPAYDPASTAELLGQFDLETIPRMIARDAPERPIALPSPETTRHEEPAHLANNPNPSSLALRNLYLRFQPLAVIVWWGTITLAGWAIFPILYAIFPGLPDRGYGIARGLALLVTSWTAWMAASLRVMPWNGVSVVVSWLVWAALGAGLAWPRRKALWAWLQENRQHVLLVEVLTLGLFVFFVLVRLGNPDLWHPAYGGEKPMELAYLNAVLRSTTFPPYDPWFAGGTLNYYYFGFVIVGAPIKALGMPVTLAFNLVIPTIFALTGIGAFSAAFNLVDGRPEEAIAIEEEAIARPSLRETLRAWPQITLGDVVGALRVPTLHAPYLAGLAALIITVFLGNLDEIRTAIWGLAELGAGQSSHVATLMPNLGTVWEGLMLTLREGQPLPVGLGEWYWNATRLIPVPLNEQGIPTEVQPITEFPYFTFLYADLHAHMIAMPIGLLALSWAIAQVKTAAKHIRLAWPIATLNGFIGALAIGVLRPTNTWDWPTYLVLGMGALALAHFIRRQRLDGQTLIGVLWRGAALALVASFVVSWPYSQHYRMPYTAIDPWTGSRTPIWAYLDIHGLHLFLIVSFMASETLTWIRTLNRSWLLPLLGLAGVTIGASGFVATHGYPIAIVAAPLIAWALVLFFGLSNQPEKQAALAITALALALTVMVEVIVLRGDIHRMNWVFKFYLQVWVLLSVAAGAAFAWLWPCLVRSRGLIRIPWTVTLGILVGLAMLYPLLATRAKITDRMAPNVPLTLDGMAYIQYAERSENGVTFSLAPDYRALRWLQDNIEEPAVVLEANTVEYHWGSRVSIYTGLPSVVGWNWHQRQQRPWESEEVFQRVNVVTQVYDTIDIQAAQAILQRYNVRYIMVGELERAYYNPLGLEKFQRMAEMGLLSVVYNVDGTTIYRVER